MNVNQAALEDLLHRVVGDLGGAMSAVLVVIGDRLGLYRTLAANGPLSARDLARQTGTAERYVREWLSNQAAGGYVSYDPETERFFMTPEQAAAFADEGGPAFLPGGFQLVTAVFKARPRIEEAFRTGEGLDWCDHDQALYDGTERFFRSSYVGHLVKDWLPALDGTVARLERGATVADVGCGHGASTVLMAKTFPRSHFAGFDYHHPSVEAAKKRAAAAGVADNTSFHVAESTEFPGRGYDLVCHFDCLHDMGDPLAAARHVREVIAPEGSWMIVEPRAGDRLEENLNPVGRVFYAASTMVCVPASLAHEGPALGAQAGEKRIRELTAEAGFTRFRRATETPFNAIYEVRP